MRTIKINIIKLSIFIILPVFLSFSCISLNYNHIIEKFIEFKDVDFNHVKVINIITGQKEFSQALSDYITISYRNRGILLPKILISDKIKEDMDYELNFVVNKNDFRITGDWQLSDDGNRIICSRTISTQVVIGIFRSSETERRTDLSDDIRFGVREEIKIPDAYKKDDGNRENRYKDLAGRNINKIDNYSLYYGVAEKLLRGFFSKRLKPISRELIRFKTGLNPDLQKAQRYLKQDKLDDALIVWEEIYSDADKSSYSRSIAAYNIGMVKANQGDYESASTYFDRSEELEIESEKDLFRL
jgi:hypothetical protein